MIADESGGHLLRIPPKAAGYANAQLDDYRSLPRSQLRWRPPLRLSLRARSSHSSPSGTLGFGFWNDPFSLSMGQGGARRRLPTPPAAIWFFYASPPNDFSFAGENPGRGFRAMSLAAPRMPPALFSLGAAAGLALTQISFLRSTLMRFALSQVAASECQLPSADLHEWHSYEIHWDRDLIQFRLDGSSAMRAHIPIQRPLGFVTWIDNQYMRATPREGLEFGRIQTEEPQWLQIDGLRLEGG